MLMPGFTRLLHFAFPGLRNLSGAGLTRRCPTSQSGAGLIDSEYCVPGQGARNAAQVTSDLIFSSCIVAPSRQPTRCRQTPPL